MKINVVRPSAVWHPEVFNEFCDLLEYSFIELGYEVQVQFDIVDKRALNIFISFFFSPEILDQAPTSSIFVQVENLVGKTDYTRQQLQYITENALNFEVWDYSPANIAILEQSGVNNVKLFEFGYVKKLQRYKPLPISLRSVDVLFYGRMNEHRRSILADMAVLGVNIKILKGRFGAERDEIMVNSKLVLNLHDYNASNFEIFRVHYPLNNAVSVLSEVNEDTSIISKYLNYIFHYPAEDLALNAKELISNPIFLDRESEQKLENFRQTSQSDLLKKMLG